MKAFFLIWPANVMPLWLLISILQVFIPLNMTLRSLCIGHVSHYRFHWASGFVILVGGILNMLTLEKHQRDAWYDNYSYYSIMVFVSVLLDVISHTIKEAIVRTQPLYQENFNYKVSMA